MQVPGTVKCIRRKTRSAKVEDRRRATNLAAVPLVLRRSLSSSNLDNFSSLTASPFAQTWTVNNAACPVKVVQIAGTFARRPTLVLPRPSLALPHQLLLLYAPFIACTRTSDRILTLCYLQSRLGGLFSFLSPFRSSTKQKQPSPEPDKDEEEEYEEEEEEAEGEENNGDQFALYGESLGRDAGGSFNEVRFDRVNNDSNTARSDLSESSRTARRPCTTFTNTTV